MVLDRKIAFIDLQEQSVKVQEIPLEIRKKFLGGRGLNMFLLAKSFHRAHDAFSPENPLIFGAGLLTGTLGFGSRINVTSRSPESGHIGDSNMGGDFGAELVRTGFSHLVITGRSPRPVYLLVRDHEVEFHSARELKGLDAVETQIRIRSELGDSRVQVACIGPAGENLVRFANVRSGMKSSAGRTGMGAVMGSKNLKAVAVRGSLDISIFEPEAYFAYYLGRMRKLMATKWAQALSTHGTPLLFRLANTSGFLSVHNNQFTAVGKEGHLLEAEALEPFSKGMVACFSCPVHCRHRFVLDDETRGEGPEYASIGSLGTKLGNLDPRTIIQGTELCNRYGLDTISTGSYIAWVMELFQRGMLHEDVTGRPLRWGDGRLVLQLIHLIAMREGFGDILAEGSRAAAAFGQGSTAYLLGVKNFPIEMTDERLPKSFALGMATSTRGACHMRSRPSVDVLGLPEQVLRKVYGGYVSPRLDDYAGKGRLVWWHETFNALVDSLGFCRFLGLFSSPHAPQYRQFSTLLRLSTGLRMSPKDLRAVGERISTLERTMLLGDGLGRKDDTLPARYFNEPVPEGPARGAVITREGFDEMLEEYYRLHGWDEQGAPKKMTLSRLGLDLED